MKSRILKKLKSKSGMTLGEVLVAVVVLLLVTSVVAAGIPVAQRAYSDVVDAGNAEVLASTTLNFLRNELASAKEVQVDGDGVMQYYLSGRTGFWTAVKNVEGGNVSFYRYSGTLDALSGDDDTDKTRITPIVTDQASTSPLKTTLKIGDSDTASITYENGVFTISNLQVIRLGTQIMTTVETYKIEALNEVRIWTAATVPDPAP